MSEPPRPSRFDWPLAGWWSLVFPANLIVYCLAAFVSAAPYSWFGIVPALALLYVSGLLLCLYRFRMGRPLVRGGVWVGLTQFLPLLHLISGMLASLVWEKLTGRWIFDLKGPWTTKPDPLMDGLGGFVMTLLTALPLALLTLAADVSLRWLLDDRPIWKPKSKEAGHE